MDLRGQLGYKGERGYSAYEIAVQNGYEGTEAEWVDSFLNAENYYNKSETDTLLATKANVSDVYTKGDYAILTGSVPHDELTLGGKALDYPTGFSQDNCVVIAAMKKNKSAYMYSTYFSVYDSQTSTSQLGMVVQMYENTIKLVTITEYSREREEPSEGNGYDYRVVLMKIPTE